MSPAGGVSYQRQPAAGATAMAGSIQSRPLLMARSRTVSTPKTAVWRNSVYERFTTPGDHLFDRTAFCTDARSSTVHAGTVNSLLAVLRFARPGFRVVHVHGQNPHTYRPEVDGTIELDTQVASGAPRADAARRGFGTHMRSINVRAVARGPSGMKVAPMRLCINFDHGCGTHSMAHPTHPRAPSIKSVESGCRASSCACGRSRCWR
jgi:hypothetical protein